MAAGASIRVDDDVAFETCRHGGRLRRVCDVCKTARYAFMACSHRCLRAHQQVAHDPGLPSAPATRVERALAERHRRSADVWELYAPHRERVMALLEQPGGGSLCVLGAGKCDDLDLPRLAQKFATLHLVDLDLEAMERARDRQPAKVRDAIVLHGGVDLSGLLPRLDEWGDAFPDDRSLPDAVFNATHAVVGELGGPFDVTLSTCVLSQLILPFQNAWVAPAETWSKLVAVIAAIHIGILSRATAPGGAAVLVFDVLSSSDLSELTGFGDRSSAELQAALDAASQSGAITLQPDPGALLAQIRDSGVAALQPAPDLTGPWLWDIGTTVQVVYGLCFRRP